VLPDARDDARIEVGRRGREALALVLLPDGGEEAIAYTRALAEAAPGFRIWDGRAVVVLAHGVRADPFVAEVADSPVALALDPGGGAARSLGVEPSGPGRAAGGGAGRRTADGAALFIADRWGQLYHVQRSTRVEELATPAEIEEWFRFLSMQCPECGVPDVPGIGVGEP